MMSGCSSTWHLTRAMKKDALLSLRDTTITYDLRSRPAVNFNLQPLLMSTKTIEVNGVKATFKPDTTSTNSEWAKACPEGTIEIDCPPDSIITREIPRLVKVELTDKEVFREARARLTDWQIARLAAGMLISVFILGAVVMFLIRLYFSLR